MKTCTRCNLENLSDEHSYCFKCGTKLQTKVYEVGTKLTTGVDVYIISSPDKDHAVLINIKSGNRWGQLTPVNRFNEITKEELAALTKGADFEVVEE